MLYECCNEVDIPNFYLFTCLQSFFSKRSFKSNPLKRTKSVTKLERTKRGSRGGVGGLLESDPLSLGSAARLRSSRSHESLLSSHNMMNTLDLAAGESLRQYYITLSCIHSYFRIRFVLPRRFTTT